MPSSLSIFKVSIGASVVTALIALSFPQYFLLVPFANGVNALSVLGFISTIGIISLVVSPPIFLLNLENWSRTKNASFLIAVSLWTVATVAIKVYTLITMGRVWADYLLIYPALIFIEWILPIFYVALALKLRRMKTARATASFS